MANLENYEYFDVARGKKIDHYKVVCENKREGEDKLLKQIECETQDIKWVGSGGIIMTGMNNNKVEYKIGYEKH